MIEIPAGLATLGQKPGEFGWDNEFAEHQVNVPGFRISKYKVTNGEYLDFVRDGGAPPHFWTQRKPQQGARWFYRGMFSEVPLPVERAGLRDAHRSRRLRALGRQNASHRSAVSSSGVREHLLTKQAPPRSVPIRGGTLSLARNEAISTFINGIPWTWMPIRRATARRVSRSSSATAGNGPPRGLARFRDFSPCPFILATRKTSSMKNTTC